jgi:hypothetical protein
MRAAPVAATAVAAGVLRRGLGSYAALPGASFHGESVEALISRASGPDWRAPPLPDTVAAAAAAEALRVPAHASPVAFGHSLRDAHFLLDPGD